MDEISPQSVDSGIKSKKPPSAFSRLMKYTLVKFLTLSIALIIGLYLTILVINLGGYVDRIIKSDISEGISGMLRAGWLRDEPEESRLKIIEETQWQIEEQMGLHQPFVLRSFRWLLRSLTLDLGTANFYYKTKPVEGNIRDIILQHLPYTMVLVGATNVLIFFSSVLVALFVSRNYGSKLDRSFMLLSPLTSAPSWIFGIILLFIFAINLRVLPTPKAYDLFSDTVNFKYMGNLLKYMILPVAAIFLSTFFVGVYSWRTYLMIYRDEDYVELAKAKGLSDRQIERSYVLKPALPYLITSFAFMALALWQGAIALEYLFWWPGIGSFFMMSLGAFNTGMTLAIVVIFAYLMAITVFALDFIYALIDPRVKIGGDNKTLRAFPIRRRVRWFWQRRSEVPVTGYVNQKVRANSNRPQETISYRLKMDFASFFQKLSASLKSDIIEIRHYPSAIFGLSIIFIFIIVSILTMIFIPYDQVLLFWRGQGGEEYTNLWIKNPRDARPVWVNLFRKDKLPPNIVLDSKDKDTPRINRVASEDMTEITYPFKFDYSYKSFPQEMILFFSSTYKEKAPYATVVLKTPDGREFELFKGAIKSQLSTYLSLDEKLKRKLKSDRLIETIFGDPTSDPIEPSQGMYELTVTGYKFEPDSEMEAEAVVYGKVYGLAGTDFKRRDLSMALLWGMPVALAFGFLGAIFTNIIAMLIAAAGVWYSGPLDELIQRITEINLILPMLPIIIFVYNMYSKSIWVILSVIVILSIFGSAVKNYRAVFLQVKEAPYIEAARAYGCSNWRIIRHYLIPRVFPVLIPQMVIMVPVYVFYEATLAYLGIYDPYLPTWGKMIYEGLTTGALDTNPFSILQPLFLLMLTGLAFAILGFALDRILNPKLRRM